MAKCKEDTRTKDILDAPVSMDRFYVRKIGVMRLIVDKAYLTVYQTHEKDAVALCKLMNELDLLRRV